MWPRETHTKLISILGADRKERSSISVNTRNKRFITGASALLRGGDTGESLSKALDHFLCHLTVAWF